MRWKRSMIGLAAGLALLSLSAMLAAATPDAEKTNPAAHPGNAVVVAADGTGDFKSVQEAVDSVPDGNAARVTIEIRPGRYEQQIRIPKGKPLIRIIGADAEKTVLTFSLNARTVGPTGRPIGTSNSASTFVDGTDFLAENVTFENSTGRDGGQALAIRVTGDRAVFRHCRFVGWQDTVMLHHNRQYFEDCYITGHVDFIFGEGTAFFEKCRIHCRAAGFITAASTQKDVTFGFVFRDCTITADPGDYKVYLGRPWRPFGSVAFIDTELPEQIQPPGWNNWDNPDNESTARFAEQGSTGPGARPAARVSWAKHLTEEQVMALTPQNVLRGNDAWDPNATAPSRSSPQTRPTTVPAIGR